MSFRSNMILCLFIIILATGCGKKIKVHGTVVFEDDQSPLTAGTVLLQNDTYVAKGQLDTTGSFQISSIKKDDGVPSGIYQVGIIGAVKSPESTESQDTQQTAMETKGTPFKDPVPLINPKYMDPKTSGITFDTSKDKVLNIVVERPETK